MMKSENNRQRQFHMKARKHSVLLSLTENSRPELCMGIPGFTFPTLTIAQGTNLTLRLDKGMLSLNGT